VAGYPGTGGRMLSEWVAGYSGMRTNMKCLGYAPHNDGRKLAQEGAEVFHDMRNLMDFLKI